MNPDVLLNRIRLEQRGLIDIHKKLYEIKKYKIKRNKILI